MKPFKGHIFLSQHGTTAFLFIFWNRVEKVWDNTGTPCLEYVTQLYKSNIPLVSTDNSCVYTNLYIIVV